MIADAVLGVLITFINWLVGIINAAWSPFNTQFGQEAVVWFLKLDRWVPVTDLLVMAGIVCTIATFSITMKWGVKLVDWIRG